MKHIFFLLVFALLVPAVQAAPVTAEMVSSRRELMLQRYAPKTAITEVLNAEQFLEAATKGDTKTIFSVTDITLFDQTDKFSNNCFHLAKDEATLQALAAVIRRLDEKNSHQIIRQLRNQRNAMGETPLMRQINLGKAQMFEPLYRGSELAQSIRQTRSVNKGGALAIPTKIKEGITKSLSKDNSGRTVAQAALANINEPGMDKVVAYFEENAPYLLNNF